jgi:small-conductance mechanosensitive channel
MKSSKSPWIWAGILLILGSATAYLFSSPYGDLLEKRWIESPLQRVLTRPILHIGSLAVTLAFLAKTALFLVLLGVVASLTRRLFQNRLLPRTFLSTGQRYAYARITSYVVYLIGIVVGLQTAGVNLNSLLVVGGAIGIGVGLGLQNLANNFVSGLVLLFEQPIKLGDRVEVGGVLGDIVRMAGRSTWVRTNENVVIIVPNSEFISGRVVNWTANDRRVRFSLPVGVSYGSDPAKVRDILMATAREHADVLEDPAPDVLFLGFGDSALNFELRVWTVRQVQTPKILASDLYYRIFDNLKAQAIEIPFPQRDLHLKSVSVPIPVSTA